MHPKRSADGYRSLPHKRPFLGAAFFALIHYLALISTITLGYILIQAEGWKLSTGFIISVSVLALSWLIGYFKRRSARCPLCKGTPLLDTAASKHRKSYRLAPLNYGTTALLSLMLSHRFRCMYCGTGFDLLRKSTSQREP
ncbi:MAG: hypothetical protein AAGI48_03725 [Verrucomicrobiota bacterium]